MTARTGRRPADRRRLVATAAIAVSGALLLTGCGDQTDGAQGGKMSSKTNSDAPLYDLLPEKVRKKGVLNVGSDIAYAPVEYRDEDGTVKGIDPDIAKELEKQLGVPFKFADGSFDTLVNGLNSGKFDLVMSAMTDTKDRQQGLDDEGEPVGAGADFVDYFRAGSSILVKKGNPKGIRTLEDLCGETVALQRGTANMALAQEQSAKCDEPIKILDFEKDPEALLQVKHGRAVADINDYPVAAYSARNSGDGEDFEVVGDQINAAPYGIAVNKKNTELRDAIAAAVNAIIKNGDYQAVLEKWDVTNGAVTKATINGGK